MSNNSLTCIIFLVILFLIFVPPLLAAGGTWVPLAHRLVAKKDPAQAETIILRMTTFGLLTKISADTLLEHYGPETGDPEQSPIGETYTPPQLSKEKMELAKFTGMKLAAVASYAARTVRCVQLVTENMRLLAEVNDLRARLGLESRPEYLNE